MPTPEKFNRHSALNQNLKRHLPPPPLRVLDVGGGSGRDSMLLATQGYRIALMDSSPAMLRLASEDAEANGVADRLQTQFGNLDDLPTLFPIPVFDTVLLHNVIQYVDDGQAALEKALAPLISGGLISVSGANRYADPYREALVWQRPEKALEQLDALPRGGYQGDDVAEGLRALGCEVLGVYGVLCVADYLGDEPGAADPAFAAQLEKLEFALSDRYPYKLLARFFQVVARKG